ncbi:MAG: thymidylate synthase [Candidatus Diapherotrites archaeon]|uniref:Thymidylate synthase n=1 Tax=Candidatus Iainarchaeum sp. TaxID=3101447 RepID=A0A8T5GFZ4_9ARCH|nr:thymidylate synthase [Candidatus Diapherotrites archaeon]MBT7241210.1 thymidylate synthase [Candidatus Diapherotrites archaeon]
MKAYLDIVKNILETGERKPTRSGMDIISLPGSLFQHDMKEGFPMLTTKKVPFKLVATELEFFIKGLTDKKWLQDRNNHIWDEWCNVDKVPWSNTEDGKAKMAAERDLGPIYGFQWRHFNAPYENYDTDYTGKGVDQLQNMIGMLKSDPNRKRIMMSAWNPIQMKQMALPPCHFNAHTTVDNGKLNLIWSQRSVDTMLGLPFNITSYALLLHLIAKECGFKEGKLVGLLADTHIYANHIEGAKEQLTRDPTKYKLPTLKTENFTSIFDWEYSDSKVENYESYPRIPFEISVV